MELSPVPIGIGPVPGGGACNRELRRIPIPRTPVNKGEMRKCLILVNSTEERKERKTENPEPKNASSSGLSLEFLFNAAATLLLRISPTGRRSLSTNCSPRKAYSRPDHRCR